MCDSHACPLIGTRTKLVFGAGNANADLMFVGEAPGAEEDRQGLPFVGRAGQLLNQMLGEIGLERGDVFIGNVLKCRPPGNRDPVPDEKEACEPYLFRQVELIRPKVIATLGNHATKQLSGKDIGIICTLGNFSTKLLSGSPMGITKVHGRPQKREVGGTPVTLFPLFHPAAALRTQSVAQLLREDFAKLPALLAEHAPPPDEEEVLDAREAEQLGLFH